MEGGRERERERGREGGRKSKRGGAERHKAAKEMATRDGEREREREKEKDEKERRSLHYSLIQKERREQITESYS